MLLITLVAMFMDPGDAEGEYAVGLYHALDDLRLFKLGVLVVDLLHGVEYLSYGLNIFGLVGMLAFKILNNFINLHNTAFFLVYNNG